MATSTGHQSPQSSLPPLQFKTINTRVWATTGNTDVVTDAYVDSNSLIDIMNTSAFVGPWYITINPGTGFTVTSANSETATTTTYSYIIL
jgi:hypothetical protein